jgi:hypothetical protein
MRERITGQRTTRKPLQLAVDSVPGTTEATRHCLGIRPHQPLGFCTDPQRNPENRQGGVPVGPSQRGCRIRQKNDIVQFDIEIRVALVGLGEA